MPRTGENIYKRKDGRWEGRYIKDHSPEGKAVYGYLYAPSYRELKNKMSQVGKQKEIKQRGNGACPIFFQVVAQEWLLSIQPHIKESTNMKYSNLLNSYILPLLGKQPISTFSHEIVQSFCNELLLKGGVKGTGLSSKTVSDCLTLVRSILQYSANRENVPLYNAKSVTIKQHQKEMRVLSQKEQEQLCHYLYEHLDERNMGILICLFTGLRIGEICALKWEDISLSEQIIRVHRTMQRIQVKDGTEKKTKILVSTPKSSCSIRTIPLPDKLIDMLAQNKKAANAYVLTGVDWKYVEPRTMQNHFQRVIKNCSIEPANYHCLRHTFATRCVELDFDIKSLSEILGHASVNITMNRYVHPSMELKRKNMMRLSELIAVK